VHGLQGGEVVIETLKSGVKISNVILESCMNHKPLDRWNSGEIEEERHNVQANDTWAKVGKRLDHPMALVCNGVVVCCSHVNDK